MVVRRFSIAVAAAAAMFAGTMSAQTPAGSAAAAQTQVAAAPQLSGGTPHWVHPETPEQRKARLATFEDPGLNPDPTKHFDRHGVSYHIARWTRREAVFDPNDPSLVRHAYVAFQYELYQLNDDYVWVWIGDPPEQQQSSEPADNAELTAPATSGRWLPEHIAFFKKIQPQFAKLDPAASEKTLTFQESSDGLPQAGSWRNSLAVADMNEDGCPDLIAPPERKGNSAPQIFLGDCKGHWHAWTTVKWPHGVDYGSVVAADFNKDGHVDLAFGVHLNGIYVFLGDGKGNFTESAEGLPRDYPTRRLAVADIDADGYPDIIVSSEGPTALGDDPHRAKLIALHNRNKGKAWEVVNVAPLDAKIGGDWLSVGNFNGDRIPDIVGSSVYFGSWDIVYLSQKAGQWKPLATDGDLIPSLSYYLASATGKFTRGAKTDDAIIAYTRFWPADLDPRILSTPPITELTEIDRLTFGKDGAKRVPIMRWSGHAGVHGLATGDFDGDGNLDIVLTMEEAGRRSIMILLGDGKGNFTAANVDGLKLEENNIYDIKVADVNGDGRPDIIVMYEIMAIHRDDFLRMVVNDKPGSIKVFLNHTPKKNANAPLKAAK